MGDAGLGWRAPVGFQDTFQTPLLAEVGALLASAPYQSLLRAKLEPFHPPSLPPGAMGWLQATLGNYIHR